MSNTKHTRIDDANRDFPQVIVSKVEFLQEFQIAQGLKCSQECDLGDRTNDVISVSYEQAVAIAREILKMMEVE